MRRLLVAVSLIVAVSAGPASTAHAAKIYKWSDRNGVVHYGDHVPPVTDTPVTVIPVRAEPGAIARLRLEDRDDAFLAWADNTLAGPIEVMLRLSRGDNVVGEPALPARATVPAHASVLVSRLGAIDPARSGRSEFRLEVVPGDPNAKPRDVEYGFPLQTTALRIDQGYGGVFSHNDMQNHHAVDFAAAIGTPILAARDGTVMQVESDFDKAGLNSEKYGGRANFVRVLHDDGSMAMYAHLKTDGVLVRVGQRVRRGQQIGLSGNTGFTTGPHLHFAVQVNRGMQLQSIPFRMFGPQGILRFSEPGVTTGN